MSHRGHMPDWLYQALPYLYSGTGVLTIYSLPNWIGVFSGAMLISAGVIVWLLRVRYRRYRRDARYRRGNPVAHDARYRHGNPVTHDVRSVESGFVRLVWRTEYECGHPIIDAQHRGLFESGNALMNAVLEEQDKLDVELMLDELIAHVEKHFCDEEALLARAQHPIGKEHQEIHRRLLVRAKVLSESYHKGQLTPGDLFTFIANDVVAQHIIKEDRKFISRDA